MLSEPSDGGETVSSEPVEWLPADGGPTVLLEPADGGPTVLSEPADGGPTVSSESVEWPPADGGPTVSEPGIIHLPAEPVLNVVLNMPVCNEEDEQVTVVQLAVDGTDCNGDMPDLSGLVPVTVARRDFSGIDGLNLGESEYVTLLVPAAMLSIDSQATEVSNTTTVTEDKTNRSRKRKQNVDTRKRVLRKRLRNSGKEYLSANGVVHRARTMGTRCSCRMHCFDKLSTEHCTSLYDSFWKMGDFDKQNSFLYGQIKCFAPKRRMVAIPCESRRQYSFAFYVKDSNGVDIRVCKAAFLSVFGLQNSRGRVNNIMTQITHGDGTPKADERGRHGNRPSKVADSVRDKVKGHIESFPRYQSHYSRRDNINRSYLGPDLSITKMHELYLEKCETLGWPKVSHDYYRRTFCNDFNIGFQTPKTDTCKTCEAMKIKLGCYTPGSAEYDAIQSEWNDHKFEANKAYELLHSDTSVARDTPTQQHVIAIDLQQALPTPKLNVGPAFYKRKIMTYNIGIHDCGANSAHMMMWPETVAGRGADEVASCLLQYIMQTDIKSKKLIIYSDNCGGQNKNHRMIALYLYLIDRGNFDEIHHKFPVSGHTMLPCDRDFGNIERFLRKRTTIYTPEEYMQAVTQTCKVNPFTVHKMEGNNFVTVEPILKCMTVRTRTKTGMKVNFREIAHLMVCRDKVGVLHFKHSHSESDAWQEVSFHKRGRQHKLANFSLPQKYNSQRALPKNKVDDVRELLDYIPPVHHSFYNNLKSDPQLPVVETERLDESDGDD